MQSTMAPVMQSTMARAMQSTKKNDDATSVQDFGTTLKLAVESFLAAWSGLATFTVVVFLVCSSGDFSFLLTLSSIISVFSFFMVAVTVMKGSSAEGVSARMMDCYVLVFASRLVSIVPWEGYLPIDKSGDWFYQGCEGLGLCLAVFICYLCRVRFEGTYDRHADTFSHLGLVVFALVLSLMLHPHLNQHMVADVAWTFALYLESITVFPQLCMFVTQEKTQPHISHFLAAQALSRLLSFVFWASSFKELSVKDHAVKQYAGHWVVGIQLLQLVIMGDFIWRYIRCLRKGIPVSELLSDVTSQMV